MRQKLTGGRSARWFGNLRIRSKMVLLYVPLILVPLVILGVYSNTMFADTMLDRARKGVSDSSELIVTRVTGMLGNVESCANMITLNLNKTLEQVPPSDLQRYARVTNELSFARLVFPDVESAAFIDEDGRVYGSAPGLEERSGEAAASQLVRDTAATSGTNVWYPMQTRSFLVTNPEEPVLTLGKSVYNINTGQRLGVLILNLREKDLSAVYGTVGTVPEGQSFIADGAGRIISSPDAAKRLLPIGEPELRQWVLGHREDMAQLRVQDRRVLAAARAFPASDWQLVSVLPMSEVAEDLRKATVLLLVIGLLCLLGAGLTAGILSQMIAGPIVRLARSMRSFNEGQLDETLEVHTADEIGFLSSGFNTMTRRMKELLTHIKSEQREKREYELALIQAQIKPHFLYNTLDVIYALSQMGRARDVQRTTKALADFYRVVLSKGMETIPLSEELQNVRDYLAIQHMRYADVFEYRLEADPETLACLVPKLTLQPLVENAIYHGLKEKLGMGRLSVRCQMTGNRLTIIVADDGAGMPPERLREVLAAVERPQGTGRERANRPAALPSGLSKPYGISNVASRIRLYYGEEYGLAISSRPGEGAVVTLTLPADVPVQAPLRTEEDKPGA